MSTAVMKVDTPVGRLVTLSAKRWHIVTDDPFTPLAIRLTSSDTRERALASWRRYARSNPTRTVLLVDADGHIERDSRLMVTS